MLPWISYAIKTCELFLHHCIQRFCCSFVYFSIGTICVRSNCAVHCLFVKAHCHSVSLGELYIWNMWIVSPSLCLKVRAILLFLLVHFAVGESVFAITVPYIVHLSKYTFIQFPLVSYTNETCRLFLFHFIRRLKPMFAFLRFQSFHWDFK